MKNIILNLEKITNSSSETIDFATELARQVELGTIIALKGDLGVGKTTFARGFARGLGISEAITSPTFTIVHEYDFETENKRGKLYHIDLYRLNSSDDASAFGIEEILADENGIKLIEWSERLDEEVFYGDFLEVEINFSDEEFYCEKRIIKVRKKA